MENNRLDRQPVFFENLDGLRFLCFLAVFFFHSFHTEIPAIINHPVYHFINQSVFGNGNLGVNFFFVLSGFLITYLLIVEKETNGKIDVLKFWMRRVLRIWPLFYLCVFVGFVVFPQIKLFFGQVPNETAHPIYYLTFLNNFDFIASGLPDASILGVLWSVAIEEQFYLVWPLVLSLFPVRKYWIPFLIVICASLWFRATHDNYMNYEFHTLSCIGDMAVGALGAWLILTKPLIIQYIEKLSKIKIVVLYILFGILFFFRKEILFENYVVRIFERLVIAFFILGIILEQNYARNSFYKMSRFKRISNLGKITYGLYCLHFLGILITLKITNKLLFNTELWQVMFLETVVALFLSIFIARISYRYFESPFLKLKDKFSFRKNA